MIVTLEEFKTFFNITANSPALNDVLTSMLEAGQKYCENYTDRLQFEAGTVTKAFPGDGAAFLYLNERPDAFDFEGGDYIKVDGVAIDSANVLFYPQLGKVELLNGYKFTEGKKIEMRYTAGWGTETVTIDEVEVTRSAAPYDLKLAVFYVAAHIYNARSGGIKEKKVGDFTIKYNDNSNLEPLATEILDRYRVCAV